MFTRKEMNQIHKAKITPEYLKSADAQKAVNEGINTALGIKNKK